LCETDLDVKEILCFYERIRKPSSELDKLEELEKKMAEAGDKIIWDALKYTGSHRDESLSPQELAQVKSNIISKLSTAYR